MGERIGIDLGTTNSVVAVADGPRPRVLDNKEAKPQTPSVVSLKKRKGKKSDGSEETLTGDVAVDNWPISPKDTIASVKRLMGRGIADPEIEKVRRQFLFDVVKPSDGTKDSIRVLMGGKEYSPIDISAMILSKLKKDAEYRLGKEVSHAVITVPAYFSQIQRDATRKAALKAGMKVIRVLDEPTAAAIAFGIDSADGAEAKTMLVYDLGGGTFDISVIMWANNVFAPLNLEGNMWLGGDNFDQVLVDHAVRHVREEYDIDPTSNLRFMAALKIASQRAKERLSAARSADIIVAGLLHDAEGDLIDVELEVTRDEFEAMIRPLVHDTVKLVEQALRNANLTKDQIDFILMAGNSTSVPMVQKAMEDMFGQEKVLRNIHPKHCVALGAAVLAARIGEGGEVFCYAPDPKDSSSECGHRNPANAFNCEKCGAPLISIGKTAPFSYGTQSAGDKYHVFIRKGDPYPTENPEVQTFYTRKSDQRIISIPVYGGDMLEKASNNEKQGEAIAILPPGLYQDTPVHIKLWLNDEGVFELTAQLDSGMDLKPWIMHGESDQKAVEAIQEMENKVAEKAKDFHPDQMKEIERIRGDAFNKMKEGNFEGAIKGVERIDGIQPAESNVDMTEQAEQLVGFAQYLLQEYQWALDPESSYRLMNVISEVKSALQRRDGREIEQKVGSLAAAIDQLPEAIRLLLGIKGAIAARIQPKYPKKAKELMEALEGVENDFKTGRIAAGQARLVQIVEDVTKALEGEEDKCTRCGAVIKGQRFCPGCGDDSWAVHDKRLHGTTSSRLKL